MSGSPGEMVLSRIAVGCIGHPDNLWGRPCRRPTPCAQANKQDAAGGQAPAMAAQQPITLASGCLCEERTAPDLARGCANPRKVRAVRVGPGHFTVTFGPGTTIKFSVRYYSQARDGGSVKDPGRGKWPARRGSGQSNSKPSRSASAPDVPPPVFRSPNEATDCRTTCRERPGA